VQPTVRLDELFHPDLAQHLHRRDLRQPRLFADTAVDRLQQCLAPMIAASSSRSASVLGKR
jgi:hypothetical protein